MRQKVGCHRVELLLSPSGRGVKLPPVLVDVPLVLGPVLASVVLAPGPVLVVVLALGAPNVFALKMFVRTNGTVVLGTLVVGVAREETLPGLEGLAGLAGLTNVLAGLIGPLTLSKSGARGLLGLATATRGVPRPGLLGTLGGPIALPVRGVQTLPGPLGLRGRGTLGAKQVGRGRRITRRGGPKHAGVHGPVGRRGGQHFRVPGVQPIPPRGRPRAHVLSRGRRRVLKLRGGRVQLQQVFGRVGPRRGRAGPRMGRVHRRALQGELQHRLFRGPLHRFEHPVVPRVLERKLLLAIMLSRTVWVPKPLQQSVRAASIQGTIHTSGKIVT